MKSSFDLESDRPYVPLFGSVDLPGSRRCSVAKKVADPLGGGQPAQPRCLLLCWRRGGLKFRLRYQQFFQ